MRDVLIREKQRAALASVFAGAVLTVLKLWAGLATASLGLLAEAAHSAFDLGAAALTWGAVRTSWRPPDEEHHYGHGKIENLAALAETGLLVLTSIWILTEGVRRLFGEGPEVEPTPWAFVVMGLSIIVDWYRARDLRRVAAESNSQALEADALHFSTDIASSTVVVLGLVGVMVSRRLGLEWMALADPVAACVVAIIVLLLSWKLGRRAVDVLMDRAPAGLSARIARGLAGLQGMHGAPRIRVRQAGDSVFADVEIRLRPGLPVAEGDRIAARARRAVKEIAGDETSVFVQLQADRDETASLRERISTAVAMEGEIAHNITLRRSPEGTQADLHLELPGKLTLAEAHDVADRVEARILEQVGELGRVDIHLELRVEEPDRANPIDPDVRAAIEARVRRAAAEVVSGGAVHDLLIAQTRGGIYLSCHCFLPPDTPLEEAHARTDRLEERLRRAIPELARVSVHAEPEGHHR
jgi:cation diffusion facilitator family transporter